MTNKINQALEHNENKDNVRDEIIAQILQHVKLLNKKTYHILTLPGYECFFEKKLKTALNKIGVELTGDCFQYTKFPGNPEYGNSYSRYREMVGNLPSGLTPHHANITEYLHEYEENNMEPTYDFVWLDYCLQFPHDNDEQKDLIVNFISNNPDSLCYATFSGMCRLMPCSKKANIIYNGCNDVRTAIFKRINYELHSLPEYMNFKPCMQIHYIGSKRTKMITFGFHHSTTKTEQIPYVDKHIETRHNHTLQIKAEVKAEIETKKYGIETMKISENGTMKLTVHQLAKAMNVHYVTAFVMMKKLVSLRKASKLGAVNLNNGGGRPTFIYSIGKETIEFLQLNQTTIDAEITA
jgi:hypothetical protein